MFLKVSQWVRGTEFNQSRAWMQLCATSTARSRRKRIGTLFCTGGGLFEYVLGPSQCSSLSRPLLPTVASQRYEALSALATAAHMVFEDWIVFVSNIQGSATDLLIRIGRTRPHPCTCIYRELRNAGERLDCAVDEVSTEQRNTPVFTEYIYSYSAWADWTISY